MNAVVFDRLEFAPPPPPGRWRAFILAILAHLLLLLALTWGINWNRESENTAADAELWASVPQQAAPAEIQPPPTPPAQQPPAAPQVAPTPPPPPAPREADIALEREKLKQQLAQQRQQELERQKKLEARKKQEELRRQELAEKKAVEDKKKKDELVKTAKAKKQQLEDERKLTVLHDEQVRRIQGLAGATGGPAATGTAQRAAGPSPSYAGRIAARIKPNIVFTDTVSGNPAAEVQIRLAPDGTIVGRKLIASSGVKSWDEAVLRAIDKTEVLPRDTDGTVVPEFPVRFRPHD
jgi:colicin import membrane protein